MDKFDIQVDAASKEGISTDNLLLYFLYSRNDRAKAHFCTCRYGDRFKLNGLPLRENNSVFPWFIGNDMEYSEL